MKTLTEQLVRYAGYHRDRRNIATHLAGIPLLIASGTVLLSRPVLMAGCLPLSVAAIGALASIACYLVLDIGFGRIMTALLALAVWLGAWCAGQSTALWLGIGLGGFVTGWALQFIGHHYEGRKPAFVDDLGSLLMGPLFVVAELMFRLGLRCDIRDAIDAQHGAAHPPRQTPSPTP
ncbi:MAG: Mpo1-like protein [Noviherbaspirillum sp.]